MFLHPKHLNMPIKLLNVITRLDRGGAPMVVLDTLNFLNKDKFEIHIATGLVDDSLKNNPKAIDPQLKIIVISQLVRNVSICNDIVALCRLYSLIRKEKYDIVHCHTSKAGFIGRIASKMANVKTVIYSPHGNIFFGYFGSFSTKIFICLEKVAAKFTDKIVTLTERGKEPYLDFNIGKNEQFTHIYNGIDINAFHMKGKIDVLQKKKGLGLLDSHVVGTIVGRLVPVKGHFYLIKSIRIVVNEFPNVRFLFVGDGILMPELKEQAKDLGVLDFIKFLGTRDDVAQILACTDIFLLSSINEGFGIAIIEAMSMKKPVVATNVDGIPEIVDNGKTGILVHPKDPEAFAYAVIKLLRNKELAVSMGIKGYEKAKNEFDILSTVKKTERLYLNKTIKN